MKAYFPAIITSYFVLLTSYLRADAVGGGGGAFSAKGAKEKAKEREEKLFHIQTSEALAPNL